MAYELLVQQNQLVHTGHFSHPLFELWGDGKTILRGLFEAFSPFGTNLPDIRVEPGLVSPADQVITVNIGLIGLHRFRFDGVESTFFNFSDAVFLQVPTILEASTRWIRTAASSFRFVSHQFVYSSHSHVKDSTAKEVLRSICTKSVSSGGLDKGAGAIFHWDVPDRHWTTQLALDRSVVVKDGLYMMFTLLVADDIADYESLARDSRSYLENVLGEIGLAFGQASF
jgi:hypothetical protein